MMQEIVATALQSAPWVGVRAEGPAVMWRLVADEPSALDTLVSASARAGVLLKRGAYQFAAIAHDQAALDRLADVMPGVMQALVPGPRRTED